ncbi:nonribosomal peptide synthetase [Robertmurraya sp.]|uniref:SF0329 family protein n=1 Tax=Robertmurraya sp. TaxID=2837525 RepID=UPI003703C996
MQWSKLKSKLESFLCDKLKGRIQIHATVYRKFHGSPSRVWITFDKKEILSASDVTYAVEHEKLYQQIRKEKMLKGIPYNPDLHVMFNSQERQELIKASDDAEGIMIKQNIFESYHLYEPFMNYNSVSIEEALKSENIIIQAFSMFDRRLGKRRLKDLNFSQDTHPLIIEFYKIRCDVEGLKDE